MFYSCLDRLEEEKAGRGPEGLLGLYCSTVL